MSCWAHPKCRFPNVMPTFANVMLFRVGLFERWHCLANWQFLQKIGTFPTLVAINWDAKQHYLFGDAIWMCSSNCSKVPDCREAPTTGVQFSISAWKCSGNGSPLNQCATSPDCRRKRCITWSIVQSFGRIVAMWWQVQNSTLNALV